ncbi:hypothetical protein WH52_07880 [Tenacibaculum holothuriorum]|uniref:Uncharacterized protein n=2 Tax=Tenacibaculum holothuriorum TaxID=1635173 RepID=A0A1Y2PCF1_9FLAO|nr:hypothetical protein WH52_07880 [Tenacibaculum holothuriorum]
MTGSCDNLFPEIKNIPKCKKCGYRTDFRFNNEEFKLKRKTMDYSSTYDGITIVSLKFKEFCNQKKYNNLEFIELKKAPNFFQVYVKGNVIEYNARMKENLCLECNQFESIIGPTINYDKISKPLDKGFYQSDLWFASGNEKSPKIIISPKTKMELEKEGFKNLCLNKIEKSL